MWLCKRNGLWASVPRSGSELSCAECWVLGLPWAVAVVKDILPSVPALYPSVVQLAVPSLCWVRAEAPQVGPCWSLPSCVDSRCCKAEQR